MHKLYRDLKSHEALYNFFKASFYFLFHLIKFRKRVCDSVCSLVTGPPMTVPPPGKLSFLSLLYTVVTYSDLRNGVCVISLRFSTPS